MESRIVKIFCVDPGLQSFGYSLLEYNVSSGQIVVLRYGTITGKSLLKQQKEMQLRFEKRYIILWELEKVLEALFLEHKPDYVVSESAFSYKFIQAYAALILVIQSTRTAAMKTLGSDIYLIAPRESKKAINFDGTSDKKSVQDAIFKNAQIIFQQNKNNQVEELTEHAYDSIAAGVAFIHNHLPSLL